MKQPIKNSILIHISNLREVLKKRKVSPELLIGTILHAWCRHKYPMLKLANLPERKSLLVDKHILTFLNILQDQALLEAAYYLSSMYALLKKEKYRKSLAMYFTPPALVKRLLDDLELKGVNFDKSSILDPACGGAAFLAPIAMRMRKVLLAKGMA